MSELESAKTEILENFIKQRITITREILLKCLAAHQQAYNQGLITYKNKKLLDTAIIDIWNNQFKSSIKVADIRSSI